MVRKKLLGLTITLGALVSFSASAAAPKCESLFGSGPKAPSPVVLKYEVTADEVAQLYAEYPKIKALIAKTVRNVKQGFESSGATKPITQVSEMTGVRYTSDSNDWATGKLNTIPAVVQKQIVDVHNILTDKKAMAKYIEKLSEEAAVLMMKEKDREVYGRLDMKDPLSDKSEVKVKKEVFLKAGQIDHVSLMRVLVNRIRARGDNIAVIPSGEKGGYDSNSTKTMKFATFFEVPKHGPFFDLYFGKGGHGQEVHLVQMDFVESVLTDRKRFWEYATALGKGEWVWDTLFDGFSQSFQQPENLGPAIQATIPVY